ncbi:MAG TPA: hypothetical protein IAA98_15475 [Candidatus Avipropionibacterium avicola]|uniref:ABC transporter ATP-binding protein n=1 Tax=Candidatus Avipropionibacterium avicola TaxID=2840701 RepID=A0A9D1H0X8_9ACTN|nr:hypothetical protein [Candidatus Avipropionibacterium avicola]
MNDDVTFLARTQQTFQLLGLAVRMVWRVGPLLLIGLGVLLVIQALVQPAQLQFMQRAVDALTHSLGLPGSKPSAGHPVFFLPDAALIVLDEPTSALDVDAERRLFDRFGELVRGRTAVMISHRFSTVRTADRIAVLADGVIAECGSHAELMDLDGRYAELFRLQADRYQ